VKVQRFVHNPIIRPHMDDRMGDNINGPSLIKVPEWVPNPLGKYYLYFAHHHGSYIRMAYADHLEGPWKIHTPGVLDLKDSLFSDHIASPDVHVLNETQEIRMYFHGCVPKTPHQMTRLAIARDGLHFEARPEILGSFYWRVFQWKDYFYTLEMPGTLRRSKSGCSDFEKGPTLFTKDMRHSAVQVIGNTLHVFYTNARDRPEQILWATINLEADWRQWRPAKPRTLLAPETEYEGADCPVEASTRGAVHGRVHQLRDPCIYEEDGKTYLLYSVAGEQGIAIGELLEIAQPPPAATQFNRMSSRITPDRVSKKIKKLSGDVWAKIRLRWALMRNAKHAQHYRATRAENPPTFIVGCGHSGTSLLLAVLGAHSKIAAVPYESHLAYDTATHLSGLKKNAQRQVIYFDELAISENKMRWVEKTPAHIHSIEDLFKLCPDARIIIIIRDGRDVACSIQDRTGSLEIGVQRWIKDNKIGQAFWPHPQVYRFKYEDLIEDFEKTMTAILHFMGEKFEERLIEYDKKPKLYYAGEIKRPPNVLGENHGLYRNWQINQPLFDGRGKWKRLSEEEKNLIKILAGDMLIEYGYAEDKNW
jgi:Sulfotransferase family